MKNSFKGNVTFQPIDQTKGELIGHQLYYKDGSNKFAPIDEELSQEFINKNCGTGSNPLVHISQVVKYYTSKRY